MENLLNQVKEILSTVPEEVIYIAIIALAIIIIAGIIKKAIKLAIVAIVFFLLSCSSLPFVGDFGKEVGMSLQGGTSSYSIWGDLYNGDSSISISW